MVTTTPADHEVRLGSIQTLTRDKDEDCWGESVTGPETDKPLGKGPSGCLLVSLTLLITKWLFGPREMHHRTGLVNKKCPVLRLCRVEGPDRKLMQLLSLVALLACTRLHKAAQCCTVLHNFTGCTLRIMSLEPLHCKYKKYKFIDQLSNITRPSLSSLLN